MLVLHTHWRAPANLSDPGGVLFWAENSDASLPMHKGGRDASPLKVHPFCLDPETLRQDIGAGTPLFDAQPGAVSLRLPTIRGLPQPSPELNHNWEVDFHAANRLSVWLVKGLWLNPSKAFSVLINLPEDNLQGGFHCSTDTRYWQAAANMVLEVLAAQKYVPTLTGDPQDLHTYFARWSAVLDGPDDALRLTDLALAMPAICRAEFVERGRKSSPGSRILPRPLLDSFINAMCDALGRAWGKSRAPKVMPGEDDPVLLWLSSLFQEDAAVKASPAQLKILDSGVRAWMRSLQAAGDANFHVAFHLITPEAISAAGGQKTWKLRYLLQGRADPSLVIPAADIWINGGKKLDGLARLLPNPQEQMLVGLGYAARFFPPILPSLQSPMPTSVLLDTEEAYAFLRDSTPLMEQAGFGLLVPPWWNQRGGRLGVRLRLQPGPASQTATPLQGMLGMNSLVRFSWELSLGATTLTREEFEALVALKTPLVQVRGQWVQFDPEQVEAAIQFWKKQEQSGEMTLLEAIRYGLGGQETAQGLPLDDVVAEGWISEWMEKLSASESLGLLPQPETLNGILRPYQRFGYSWLDFFRRYGLGACLADDMGLGKTIQALALLLREKTATGRLPGPVMLVCPTSVVSNWEHEIRRFTPSLTILMHQGANRLRNSDLQKAVQQVDVVLSSYAVIRQDADTLQDIPWWGLILDEAQNIKNPAAKVTQVVRKLPASYRLALTGTPVENRLTELWSIMSFLNPGYLGTLENFRRNYAIPIERFNEPDVTRRLRQMVSPFILRRLKTDPNVIQDLPEKIEIKEYCSLTEEQASLYAAVVHDTMQQVEEAKGMGRKGLVLKLLMQLKQICNHPAQYLHQGEMGGLDLAEKKSRSGKLTRLGEVLEEILEVQDRVLVFTQFAEMGRLLADYLPQKLGCGVQFLHGGVPAKNREPMVRRFQEEDHAPPVFILSLKAGGLGLNLTRANHVIHFDRWWNPAVEDQATDRTYRIGQTRNVQVRKFITTGTLEEKIDEMIESKKGLVEAVLGGGEEGFTELTTDELRQLVELRR